MKVKENWREILKRRTHLGDFYGVPSTEILGVIEQVSRGDYKSNRSFLWVGDYCLPAEILEELK